MANHRSIYSWRNRWLQALAALIVLTLIVRLAWGWYATRILDREIQAARYRAEPLSISDLPYQKVPDEKNIWLLQTKAATLAIATGVDSPRCSALEFKRWFPPFPPVWTQMARESEKAHAPVFDLLRQARNLHEVDFGGPPIGPMGRIGASWNSMRQLANVTADSAMLHHVQGDDLEALARNCDVLHLARSIHREETMISQLVAIGIEALANDNLQIIAPGLRFNQTRSSAALRAETQKLIDELLDEEANWAALHQCLQFERLLFIDSIRTNSKYNWALHPLANLEEARLLRNSPTVVRIGKIRTKPQLSAELARRQTDDDYWEPIPRSLPAPAPPGPSRRFPRWTNMYAYNARFIETSFRAIADRRVTAIDLALQLYRADHQHWPQSLDELVPAYVPRLPLDPYHDDARPIGYIIIKNPGQPDRPLLYFDAGRTEDVQISDEPMYGWQAEQRSPFKVTSPDIRQYRDVSRFYPSATTQGVIPPPSTNAADGNLY